MDKAEAQERIEKLKDWLKKWNYDYFVLDKSDISEAARDKIKRELEDLEKEFPEFITPDSPTQRVGAPPLESFKKVKHKVRMLSLSNALTKQEADDFDDRVKRFLKTSFLLSITWLFAILQSIKDF